MVKAFSGQTERTRPNSRFQQQNLLETTPVLMRLPTVDCPPFSLAEPDSVDCQSNIQEFAPNLARSCAVSSQEGEKSVSDSPHGPAPKSVDSISATTVAARSDGTRSWWEHWSSGVVMILLIVAMVVLGILAVRSNSQPTNSIATTELESEFGDLDSIPIPETQITDATPVFSNPTFSTSNELEPSEPTESALATDLANAVVEPFENPSVGASDSAPTNGTGLPLPSEMPPSGNLAGQDQLATATLMQPTPGDVPQQEYTQMPSFPSLSEANQLSSTAQTANSVPALPAKNQIGQNASLVDSATQQSQTELSQNGTNSTSFSIPNLAGNKPAAAPVATQVSTSLPVKSREQESLHLRSTSTPDANEEEIIRAYLDLSQGTTPPTSGPNTSNPNRYQR